MKQYFRESEAVLKQVLPLRPVASIVFGYYPLHENGPPKTVEMTLAWYRLEHRMAPRLECYANDFEAFERFRDVLDALARWGDRELQPENFIDLLERLGFRSINHSTS